MRLTGNRLILVSLLDLNFVSVSKKILINLTVPNQETLINMCFARFDRRQPMVAGGSHQRVACMRTCRCTCMPLCMHAHMQVRMHALCMHALHAHACGPYRGQPLGCASTYIYFFCFQNFF